MAKPYTIKRICELETTAKKISNPCPDFGLARLGNAWLPDSAHPVLLRSKADPNHREGGHFSTSCGKPGRHHRSSHTPAWCPHHLPKHRQSPCLRRDNERITGIAEKTWHGPVLVILTQSGTLAITRPGRVLGLIPNASLAMGASCLGGILLAVEVFTLCERASNCSRKSEWEKMVQPLMTRGSMVAKFSFPQFDHHLSPITLKEY